jgi:hypothetical protein
MKKVMMTDVIIHCRAAAIASLVMTGYATDLSQQCKIPFSFVIVFRVD